MAERHTPAADVDALTVDVQRLRERVATLKIKKQQLEEQVKERDARIEKLVASNQRLRQSRLRGPLEYTYRLLARKGHPRITKEQLARVETEIASATLEQVTGLFPQDRLLHNFVLNIWEWAHGCIELTSLPWSVSLPISDVCNARCTFCTSWLDGRKQLTLEQLDQFAPVLRTAVYVGLVGHGEPLSHPQLGDIADRLAEYLDRRAASYTITNGVYLSKWLDRLDQLHLSSISCSLNAATPETHHTVMGFPPDEFPKVVENLRLLAAGKITTKPVAVSVTMVVTRQNIEEIPAFIELGNDIGATSMYLRTLLPQGNLVRGLNYHDLPPYLHPDFERLRTNAISAMQASAVPVQGEPDTWSSPIFPEAFTQQLAASTPVLISRADAKREASARAAAESTYPLSVRPLRGEANPDPVFADTLKDASNPLGRQAPFRCRAVYNNLYANHVFLRVSPCCYLTHTPGHDEIRLTDVSDVVEAWNAVSFRELRNRLASGPLYGACERCPTAW
ncbi:MAG TPA: radical SAM protein [Vicinamibacterales bacterium]|jgi:sulfatase maturation enzyme AslB (radical SAM superfamily)